MIAQTTAPAQAPALKCPRCGAALEACRPGGKGEAAPVLTCTNPEGCIGPLTADFAPGGALAPIEPAAEVPAIAPLVALNKTRRSAKVPGLAYEVQTTERGHYIEFRHGLAREGYELIGGRVLLAWQSDKGVMPREVADYCKAFAAQLAGHVAREAV